MTDTAPPPFDSIAADARIAMLETTRDHGMREAEGLTAGMREAALMRAMNAQELLGNYARPLINEVMRLEAALEAAQEVLVFADGLAVSRTGQALADLFASDAPDQQVLTAAGCHGRGKFAPDLTPTTPPQCACRGLLKDADTFHSLGECRP